MSIVILDGIFVFPLAQTTNYYMFFVFSTWRRHHYGTEMSWRDSLAYVFDRNISVQQLCLCHWDSMFGAVSVILGL